MKHATQKLAGKLRICVMKDGFSSLAGILDSNSEGVQRELRKLLSAGRELGKPRDLALIWQGAAPALYVVS